MLKKIALCSGLLAWAMIGFSSCKKCMNCTTTNKKTGKQVDVYPEICGKKSSLDNQELNYRYNLPDSLELSCSRK